jgi:probable F420-dependent oxidoreductase
MQFGCTLPNIGPASTRDGIRNFAQNAEQMGCSTLWVADRLLFPVYSRSKYPASADGSLPDFYRRSLDPLIALSWAAACTHRIRLGTGILQMPFYNPALLGRQLTSLDILSEGRLLVGIGQGWSEDEFEAAGVQASERAARADELLKALKAMWQAEPSQYSGEHFRMAASVLVKPVQTPRPPILLAGFAAAALRRVALSADGWLPVGLPLHLIASNWGQILQEARAAGRADKLQLRVGAFVQLSSERVVGERPAFTGCEAQVRADIDGLRAIGADELYFTLVPERPDASDGLRQLEKLLKLAAR